MSDDGVPQVKYYAENQEYSLFLGLMKSRNSSRFSSFKTKNSSDAHDSNSLPQSLLGSTAFQEWKNYSINFFIKMSRRSSQLTEMENELLGRDSTDDSYVENLKTKTE